MHFYRRIFCLQFLLISIGISLFKEINTKLTLNIERAWQNYDFLWKFELETSNSFCVMWFWKLLILQNGSLVLLPTVKSERKVKTYISHSIARKKLKLSNISYITKVSKVLPLGCIFTWFFKYQVHLGGKSTNEPIHSL